MHKELGENALERWPKLLDAELDGEPLFGAIDGAKITALRFKNEQRKVPDIDPSSWAPFKPKMTALVLQAFCHGNDCLPYDGLPIIIEAPVSLGSANRTLSKLVMKRAIDWLMINRNAAIVATGEFMPEQLEDEMRTHRVLTRCAVDVLWYLHAVTVAMVPAEDSVLLTIQNSDERLAGMGTKGCGLVFCAKGRALFERATADALRRCESC